MTHMEKLINEQVAKSVLGTVGRTTDRVAETMAREILRDKAFRSRMEGLIKRAFEKTLIELERENG